MDIVIKRDKGGLGDIFMHRMMFEDMKKQYDKLYFACPKAYHEAVQDHPYLDKLIDLADIPENFRVLNTSHICNRYEIAKAPYVDKHRSDIWAEHCGIKLENHNMHFHLTDNEKNWGYKTLQNEKKTIAFSPISAMTGKNLDNKQIEEVVHNLQKMGYYVFILHNKSLPIKAPQMVNCSIRQFMSLIYCSNYIVTVDTATFHCAGGMGKPLVGIFSFIDGVVYGQYYDFVLVQKHRDMDPFWTCGPCYDFTKCPKLPEIIKMRKPCITEITTEMIMAGIEKMLK